MKKWQAIVFDLDDTLYREHDYALSGLRAAAQWAEAEWGISAEQGSRELEDLFRSGIRGNVFDRWLSRYEFQEAAHVAQLVKVYRDHIPQLRPFPEVPALLLRLRDSHRLGLVSDGHLNIQRRKLEALGLALWFDAVVFSDELGREYWKPSTKPFEVVTEQLRVEPRRAVYVADNPIKDFFGARQAGLATIHLRQPGGEYSHFTAPDSAHAADTVIATLSDLLPALKELRPNDRDGG